MRSFHVILALAAVVAVTGSLQAQSQLQVSPASVSLSSQVNNPVAATQVLSLTSTGDNAGDHLSYAAAVQINSTAPNTLPWLSISGSASGTTPGYIELSAVATSPGYTALAEGVYTGQIVVAVSGNATPVTIPVTFTVARIAAAPASLAFSYQIGGPVPSSQPLAVSTVSGVLNFMASVSVSGSQNWLELAPTEATTPATVTVTLNPAVIGTLAAGTYSGAVNVGAVGDPIMVSVPVTLTVSAASVITVSPASMTFLYQTGGTNNISQQNLSVTANSGVELFFVSASVNPNPAGVQWLVASVQGLNNTPGMVTVQVSPGALPPGTYTGDVTVSVNGMQVADVPVSLTVSSNPLISFTPTSLSFSYQLGGSTPAAQSVATASTGAPLVYAVSVSTTTGGAWLEAASGGTTPNPISVSVNTSGLGVGLYNGLITVSVNNAGNSPQRIPVTLTVTNYPTIEAFPGQMTFAYQIGKTGPNNQVLTLTSSTGDRLNFTSTTSTASGGPWLKTSGGGSTPGTVNIGINTNDLVPGTYTGTVSIAATNPDGDTVPNSPLAVPVSLYVSNDPLLTVSPGALSFTAALGVQTPVQTLNIASTGDALNYTIAAVTQTGGPWLAVTAQPGTTPGSIQVYSLPLNLSSGIYNATITVSATNPSSAPVADSPVTVPVTLQLVEGTLSVSPTALTFSQTLGGAAPASKTISVSGSGTQPLAFTAVASTSSGINWLTVTPTSGDTPATVSVTADGSKLSPGTYTGVITITAPSALSSPQSVAVTLTVGGTNITLSPTSLQFNYQLGGTTPGSQSLAVSSSPENVGFNVTSTTLGSGNWLTVSPTSGTVPANLTVSVNPAGLAAGVYSGVITVTPTAAGINAQNANVTLTVTVPVPPQPASVNNSANEAPGSVAPGEIVAIYGTNLGPTQPAYGTITGNSLSTSVSGVQVTFSNTPAPLLFVSATQINAVVPFELTGQVQTQMKVSYNGGVSTALELNVAPAAPAVYTQTETGTGPGAILNLAGELISATNPAQQGSIIEIYATGGGETDPLGVTGNITPADGSVLKRVSGVDVTVAGQPCTVIYAGTAPGFVEGALQINAQLPPGLPSGAQPLLVSVNGITSSGGVTVALQ